MRDTERPGPCSDTIHWTHSELPADDQGHPIVMVHARYLTRLQAAFGSVSELHRKNPEGFVPACAYDGEPYPCTTMRMLNPQEVS